MGLRNTFGTVEKDVGRNNVIYVESLNGFPAPVNDVITLETGKEYIRTRPINFGINQIKIPDGGIVTISALNPTSNILLTELTGTTPLFFGNVGRFQIRDTLIISLSEAGAVFNIFADSDSSFVVLENTATVGFNTIGTIDGVNLLSENAGWVGNKGGLTLNNIKIANVAEQQFAEEPLAVTKKLITDLLGLSFVFNHEGDHYVITGTMERGFFQTILGSPSTGDAVFNIDSNAVIDSFNVSNGALNDSNGGTWFKVGGLDQTDPEILAFNNNNVTDSNWVGSTGFTGGATETVFSDTSTFIKAAGTYVDGYLERFTSDSGTLTYIGLEAKILSITGVITPLLTSNTETDTIQGAAFLNGVEVSNGRIQKTLGAVFQTPTSPEMRCTSNVLFSTGDTIEVRWRNISNPTNMIATDARISVGQ